VIGHDGDGVLRAETQEAEMINAEIAVTDWLHLIRAEYLEIPGLYLTKPQVQRVVGARRRNM